MTGKLIPPTKAIITQINAAHDAVVESGKSAYRRLCARGKFIQPASGRALAQRIEEKATPYAAFMSACFVEDPKGSVPCWSFYRTFLKWCEENRQSYLTTSITGANQLIREVKKIERWSWLKSTQPHGDKRVYAGISPRVNEN